MSKTEVIEPLSAAERRELTEHESKIEKGIKGFQEAGEALAAIREKKLYREEHGTFEAYVKTKWDFSRQYAYKLIGRSEVGKNVASWLTKPSGATAEELGKYGSKQQKRIAKNLSKSKEKVTARNVQKVADKIKAEPRNQKPPSRGGLQAEYLSQKAGREDAESNAAETKPPKSGKLSPALKEMIAGMITTWYEENKAKLNDYPMVQPAHMVRRIIQDLFI